MSAAILHQKTLLSLSDTPTHRPAKEISKSALAFGLAGAVTLSLFMTMEYLIRIDAVEIIEEKTGGIRDIHPEAPKVDEPRTERSPIERIETAIPPAKPIINDQKTSAPELPTPKIDPTAPELSIGDFIIPTSMHSGPTVAMAIRQPIPTYPKSALRQGLSGSCMVAFSLTQQGQPFNITADCSDPAFAKSAERAVGKAAFSPAKDANGLPIISHNMVFPLEYKMN
ncbi:energy transducer TonB [Hirschia maritima]|uniref:energy transducer TonB n=1 Tax=Hirschia maritima TaxID=1121961 RepID=UPI000374AB77|nr:energy transducer TonB [Hirschia maritima]